MIYKPPIQDITNEQHTKRMLRMTIKKILKDDPELLSEIISELRQEKLKKQKDKIN